MDFCLARAKPFIWIIAGISLIRLLEGNFSEILIIQENAFEYV